jgi:TROVE domain-containing protein
MPHHRWPEVRKSRRFNTPGTRPRTTSPLATEPVATGRTYEGAPGYARDAKTELFLLAVVNLGDNGFYETAAARNSRFVSLIRQVAVEDPEWITGFLPWLRHKGQIRTASVIGAAEAAHALHAAGKPGGRQIIAGTLARADEPGELLAYWTQAFGRKLPWPVKRGLSDAAIKLYDEYRLMKYDTPSHGYRFADVLALTHPGEKRNRQHVPGSQGDLFGHAIGRRYGRDSGDALDMIAANRNLRAAAAGDPSVLLDGRALKAAGFTWQDALSLAGDRVPKKALWEALIPVMGYEALLKNLRNFDDAGVPDEVAAQVSARLTDPGAVARSRQFPMRFLVAYQEAGLRWAYPLEQALGHSLGNVPALRGSTLILVDRSGSMFMGNALRNDPKSGLPRAETAALFGTALALRAERADLVQFGSSSEPVRFGKHQAVLQVMGAFREMGGTETGLAIQRNYHGQDRVVILTDEQAFRSAADMLGPLALIPANVPVYTWSLGGYRRGHAAAGPARHLFGGLSDAAFSMISLLEAGKDARWPWQ